MPKLRVESFTISLDGFGAGPNQDPRNPLGVGGARPSTRGQLLREPWSTPGWPAGRKK